jgi:hypothetical protein
MPDWASIEKSFSRISHQQQIGELASSLSRFKGWLLKGKANSEVASVILDESILYTSLIQKESLIAELAELQKQLLSWRASFSSLYEQETELNNVSQISASWSDRLLDMSGLLELVK